MDSQWCDLFYFCIRRMLKSFMRWPRKHFNNLSTIESAPTTLALCSLHSGMRGGNKTFLCNRYFCVLLKRTYDRNFQETSYFTTKTNVLCFEYWLKITLFRFIFRKQIHTYFFCIICPTKNDLLHRSLFWLRNGWSFGIFPILSAL